MNKIPTIFERDWDGDRGRVLNRIHKDCEWVINGEGIPTRKLDGTCCLIRDGKLFKRAEYKKGKTVSSDFEEIEFDEETGKRFGWRPVEEGNEDKWHREGFNNLINRNNGTYELVGPKIQGNPEKYYEHILVPHSQLEIKESIDRSFEGIKNYLIDRDIEGIVFHHQDGRMAKIKKRDYGLKR